MGPWRPRTRRVAVLGGNRIPFARSNTAYADASNQEMLTAAIDGLVDPVRARGRAARRGRRRRRAQALPRLQPDPRVGARLEARRPRRPATDIQQACGTGLQAAIQVANKIALGQIDVGIAGGTDTTSDAPGRDQRQAAQEADEGQRRARHRRAGSRRSAQIRPGDIGLEIPQNGEPRTRLSMGEHAALTALEWQIGREEQDELAAASHQRLAAAYDARLPRRPGHAVPRPRARQQPAPRLLGREAGEAQAGLRQGRGGDDDRRQLHAADRRRLGGAAGLGGRGPRSTGCRALAYLVGLRDRRRRLRARRRGPADGAGVRRAADARSARG